MKVSIASAAAVVMLISLPVLAQETYVIEPVHSQPQWIARHIGMSNQHGNFGKATGKIVLDRAAKKGSIDVSIDASSIRTYSDRLDQIVKGERFFNVEKFPTITFKSTNLAFDGDKVVGAEGELTMLGVTKPVSLKVTGFTCGEQAFNKKPMCGAEASAVIKRSEWGMTDGIKLGNPADEISLIIPIEAYRDVS